MKWHEFIGALRIAAILLIPSNLVAGLVPAPSMEVTALGLKLGAPMQALEAYVNPTGVRFRSVSKSEGREDFSIIPISMDNQSIPSVGVASSSDSNSILLDKEILIERFSASSEGIRQDFIVRDRPRVNGRMKIQLMVHGALAQSANRGISLSLPSGRAFVYNKLKVMDANGKSLEASMLALEKQKIEIAVEFSGARFPVTIDPTLTDADWMALNKEGIQGANGAINSSASHEGNFYFGGGFSGAGNISAHNIVKWDGSKWDSLGSGTSGIIKALVCDSIGNLFVCGSFKYAGGHPVYGIAKWDGTNWSALGSGLVNELFCSALSIGKGGKLYAGGDFTKMGSQSIAVWDGVEWKGLGTGLTSKTKWGGIVRSIACDTAGNVYAGGNLDTAGNLPADGIAKWNGSRWSALGKGIHKKASGQEVSVLAWDSYGNLYAGGTFDSIGDVSASNIAKWDGNAWSALGFGVNNNVAALVCKPSGNVVAGGAFTSAGIIPANHIAEWNGILWAPLGAGLDKPVSTLAYDGSRALIACGIAYGSHSYPFSSISQWDGSAWSPIGNGINGPIRDIAADKKGNLFFGGDFTTIGGIKANHLAQWDGSVWSGMGGGLNRSVNALLLDNEGFLYAGGNFDSAGGIKSKSIAKWDGKKWSPLGSGLNVKGNDGGNYVAKLAFDKKGRVIAGGVFDSAGGVAVHYLAMWDGNRWSSMGQGMDALVSAFANDSSGNLYAAGPLTVSSRWKASVARWDGERWEALHSDTLFGFYPYAVICDAKGNLYVGGDFKSIEGVPAKNIAKWDGSNWSAVGSGVDSAVGNLAIDNSGNIYASSKVPAGISKWDGTRWTEIGSGTDKLIFAMRIFDSTLYAGGNFVQIGGKNSACMARCNLHTPASNSIQYGLSENAAASPPDYRWIHSILVFSNIEKNDMISITSLSGRQVYAAKGATHIDLSGLGPQVLVVRVHRSERTISTGMVMIEPR